MQTMCVIMRIMKTMHLSYTWCCPNIKETSSSKTLQSQKQRMRDLSHKKWDLGNPGTCSISCLFPMPSSLKGLFSLSMVHAPCLVNTFHTDYKDAHFYLLLLEMLISYLHF